MIFGEMQTARLSGLQGCEAPKAWPCNLENRVVASNLIQFEFDFQFDFLITLFSFPFFQELSVMTRTTLGILFDYASIPPSIRFSSTSR